MSIDGMTGLPEGLVAPATRPEGGSVWDDGRPTPGELSVLDWLLTTTRANRRTLDLERPGGTDVLEECLEIALQAPAAHNDQRWHWIVVTDPQTKAALADLYVKAWAAATRHERRRSRRFQNVDQSQGRTQDSAQWLAAHIHQVPVFVVPCITGIRPDDPRMAETWGALMLEGGLDPLENGPSEAAYWGSIFPAIWSFQLALRARGLGSVMTVMHLAAEREAAELLGLPKGVTQAGLLPVAHLTRTTFKPAKRHPLRTRLSYDRWGRAQPGVGG